MKSIHTPGMGFDRHGRLGTDRTFFSKPGRFRGLVRETMNFDFISESTETPDKEQNMPPAQRPHGAYTPAERVGRDDEKTPADDLKAKMIGYLGQKNATEADLKCFSDIWDRLHDSATQAMDSRGVRRGRRPMTSAETAAFEARFPDAARVRVR